MGYTTSAKYCLLVPVFHFWQKKLTHPAARSLCDSWSTCIWLLLSLSGRRRDLSAQQWTQSLLQTTHSGRVVSSRAENDDWTTVLSVMGDHRSSLRIVLMLLLLLLLESNSQITCIYLGRRVVLVPLRKSCKPVFTPTSESWTLIVTNTGSPPFHIHVHSLRSNSISLIRQTCTCVDGLLFCCRRFFDTAPLISHSVERRPVKRMITTAVSNLAVPTQLSAFSVIAELLFIKSQSWATRCTRWDTLDI